MNRGTEWPYLLRSEPAVAKKRILEAYSNAKGNAVHAARALGISHRSLMRYVATLVLQEAIAQVRAAARVVREGGVAAEDPPTARRRRREKRASS